jgi:hypothetical protein
MIKIGTRLAAINSADGNSVAYRVFPAKKNEVRGAVAEFADKKRTLVQCHKLDRWTGLTVRNETILGTGINSKLADNKKCLIKLYNKEFKSTYHSGVDGASIGGYINYSNFPYLSKWVFTVDDIAIISSQPTVVSGYSITAVDGFILAPNYGFIDARSGNTLTVTVGSNSYSVDMEDNISTAEQISLAEGAGIPVVRSDDELFVEDLLDWILEELETQQEAQIYVGGLVVGSGFISLKIYDTTKNVGESVTIS